MVTPSDARSPDGADQHETFGRYRLLERIGRGGMAEVFKAKSFGVEGFEKVLVIKRILPELVASKRFVDLFVHEAKLAVRLSHANIVQVFDLGKVEDGPLPQYFIAMEHVAGLDLATLLARGKRRGMTFPLGMSAYIAAEVAKGLDHAHRRRDEQMRPLGIVHRDVSPQNVLLSWEGEVKVTDFGIAKARDTLDERPEDETSGIVLQGKYGYMSPEQAMGEPVDARSDIFSLGTVLYEAICGAHPFRAATAEETLRRVRAAEYPPLEIVRTDVPKELAAVVTKALSKEPGDRYPDAGRMHEDLLAFLYSSASRFGPNELSALLAEFRDPSPGVVVELGTESPEETRPHPRAPQTLTEPETRKLPTAKPEPLRRSKVAALRYGKFVGQRQSLSKLGEIFALATRRKAQVVTLRGEAGIGKSRFLQEVERRLRRGNLDVAFYVVTCPPEGALHPLSGLSAMLRAIAGITEGEEPARIEELAPRLRALGLREEEVGAVLAQLGAPGKVATTGLLRAAFARIVTKLSSDQLHIFAWDDAHELDSESIALLDAALPRMAGARSVFLLTGRPGLSHTLERLTSHHAISLGPLEPSDVEQLVAARTGARQVPAELLAFCQERSKGHPLFLEELLRELFVRDRIAVEHGGVTKLDLADLSTLPHSLDELLSARFDELSDDERALLEAVAALGDAASLERLAAMTAMAEDEVQAAVVSLEGERLLVRKGDDSVAFLAPKVREALWATLTEEAKQRLRSMAAAAYETLLEKEAREQKASPSPGISWKPAKATRQPRTLRSPPRVRSRWGSGRGQGGRSRSRSSRAIPRVARSRSSPTGWSVSRRRCTGCVAPTRRWRWPSGSSLVSTKPAIRRRASSCACIWPARSVPCTSSTRRTSTWPPHASSATTTRASCVAPFSTRGSWGSVRAISEGPSPPSRRHPSSKPPRPAPNRRASWEGSRNRWRRRGRPSGRSR